MKCPNCKKELSNTATFCNRCGVDLNEPSNKKENKYIKRIVLTVFCVVLAICFLIPKLRIIGILIVLLFGILFFYRKKGNEEPKVEEPIVELVKLTDDAIHFEKKHYKKVKEIYKKIGFKNIETVNRKDIVIRLLTKPGRVESVLINNEEPEADKWYNPEDTVIITYHGIDKENSVEDILPFGVDLD